MTSAIDQIDFFYLAMPKIEDRADGSQDALLARVIAGDFLGWGECEASPLVSIAALVCPTSHRACKPVQDAILGEKLDSLDDIERIVKNVRNNSLDLLQAEHTLSGIEIALCDLLARKREIPVYRLLGYERSFPKIPYASALFGQEPNETFKKAQAMISIGFRAAKFGWGPYGHGLPEQDADQVQAAREGLGMDAILMIDAGTVWQEDVEKAAARIGSLESVGALWLEEPFVSGALNAYFSLAQRSKRVRLAGGEGAHQFHMARNMIDYGAVGFIQIDTGRIGGITTAKRVADYAQSHGVTYVNHTFTSHLALSASLQPYAGLCDHDICEFPIEATPLAVELTTSRIEMDSNGCLSVPEAPGLGIQPDLKTLKRYLVEVEIRAGGHTLYKTPEVEI